jgi:hypothetical protein
MRAALVVTAAAAALALATAASAETLDPLKATFGSSVALSDASNQAAEPSIRVDAPDLNQRIWVAAPTGIGVNARSVPAVGTAEGGDLFWYSDNDGKSFTRVDDATIIGGGDTDVATRFGSEVYGTGLTLANITLSASCDNGSTWQPNPLSNLLTGEDRQWIDTWEDRPAPPGDAADFVVDYGEIALGKVVFHRVLSPLCVPPVSEQPLDVSHPNCITGTEDDCYQWPGNLAVDERNGDVYVTHNTRGNADGVNDDIVVARVDGGAARTVTQADVHPFIAANDRPDTFDSFTVTAVDKAGNVYVVWNERHPEVQGTDVMLAVSTTHGETWGAPIRVNRTPATAVFPWIVAGDGGKIDVVYYGTTAHGPSAETVPESSLWRVYLAQSLNATAAKPSFKESAATGYMQQGSICTSGTGCAAGTRDLLDYFQVDVDRAGMANIAYTDNLNTPPDGDDPHQEWVEFVQQKGGKGLYGS